MYIYMYTCIQYIYMCVFYMYVSYCIVLYCIVLVFVLLSCLMSCHFACWVCICALNWPWWHWHAILTVRSNFEMQPPVWGASGHCLREVNIEEEEEGEGSQKLFDAFDCFLNFSFCLNPCLVFKLTSRRAEKDQWPQHLGLRPAHKAFRSSPHTTWAPGDKTADCLC